MRCANIWETVFQARGSARSILGTFEEQQREGKGAVERWSQERVVGNDVIGVEDLVGS